MNPGRLGWLGGFVALSAALLYWSRRPLGVDAPASPRSPLSGIALPTPSPAEHERAPSSADATQSPEPSLDPEAAAVLRIRSALERSPKTALELIEAGDRAGSREPFAEERAMLRVEALARSGEIGLARDAAEGYLRAYPNGAYAQHLEALTGVHPRPPEAP